MKIAESRDIKWKRKLNVDTDKVIEKVYHTNEFHQIVEDVLVSYVNDTVLKSDEELREDRNDWIKRFAIDKEKRQGSDEDKKEFVYWADIHTLAIEIEQIRRFGTIQYDSELMTENILEKVLLEQSQE